MTPIPAVTLDMGMQNPKHGWNGNLIQNWSRSQILGWVYPRTRSWQKTAFLVPTHQKERFKTEVNPSLITGCFHQTPFSELCVTSCNSRSPSVTRETLSDPSSPYTSRIPLTDHQAPDVILSEGSSSFMHIFLQDPGWKCVWLAVTDREASSNIRCSPVYH